MHCELKRFLSVVKVKFVFQNLRKHIKRYFVKRKNEWLSSGRKYLLSDEIYESVNESFWMLPRID
jgi:hypothetical protein